MAGTLYFYIDDNCVHQSSISSDSFAQDVRVGDYIDMGYEKKPLLVTKIVHHPTGWGGNCDVYLQHVDMDAEKKAKQKEKEIEQANSRLLYI